MKCKQLVMGGPHFVGTMDAATEGTGGGLVGKKDECVPAVFHLQWPQNIQDMACTNDNPNRPTTNSDLELVGILLCWIVMEEVPHDSNTNMWACIVTIP